MQELLREIRGQLRLAMNGVVSTSMREKGINYRFNFGVSIPELRRMARNYETKITAEMAEMMWKEDVRELKILATMLYPSADFLPDTAKRWTSEIPYPEITEQCVFNLFCHTSFAVEMMRWGVNEGSLPYARQMAFLMLARLSLLQDGRLAGEKPDFWVKEVIRSIEHAPEYERQAALQGLRNFGRLGNGRRILEVLEGYKESPVSRIQGMYADLKFEFELL